MTSSILNSLRKALFMSPLPKPPPAAQASRVQQKAQEFIDLRQDPINLPPKQLCRVLTPTLFGALASPKCPANCRDEPAMTPQQKLDFWVEAERSAGNPQAAQIAQEISAATERIDLSDTNLRTLPPNLAGKRLKELRLHNCFNLEMLPESVHSWPFVEKFTLSHCDRLEKVPDALKYLWSLQALTVDGAANLKHLPAEIGNLDAMTVRDCPQLEALPDLAHRVRSSLRDTIDEYRYIRQLTVINCPKLAGVPMYPGLEYLEVDGCPRVTDQGGIWQLPDFEP